jgi:serine/threonine-protein kinase
LAYSNRGLALVNQGDYDKGIADLNEAIRLDAKFVQAYQDRARGWNKKGDYEKAIADFNATIQLDPKNAAAYNSLAWILATCPDGKVRDGKQAVVDATKGCELTNWNDPAYLDTLAAAYAEAGDFAAAVKWQEQAIKLVKDETSKKAFADRLALYQQRKPYREKPPAR